MKKFGIIVLIITVIAGAFRAGTKRKNTTNNIDSTVLTGNILDHTGINLSNLDETNQKLYQKLEQACNAIDNKNEKSCCISSLEYMAGESREITSISKDGCPQDYVEDGLYCEGSYKWCTFMGIKNDSELFDNIPQPQKADIIDDNERLSGIKLPDNIITEKECSAAGGEVWNTLGETEIKGELIGTIEGLRCPCACLIRSEASNVLRVNIDGDIQEFTGDTKEIKTFDDCKNAGFKILDTKLEICQIGEPYMTNGNYNTFTNHPRAEGKTCIDYTYSTCPGSCVANCTSSECSTQIMEDGEKLTICTSDCDGAGSCVEKE